MHSYDYPKVRPPSSVPAIERHTNPRPLASQSRHFSYSQTPIEARAPSLTRDFNIPPLPQVPAHLAAEVVPPQQTGIPELQSAQSEYPPDVKQNMYHNQPWRSAAEGYTAPPARENQYPASLHSDDPLPERYIVPLLQPDGNPLTPTSPSHMSTTTNTAFRSPTTPNYVSFSAPIQPVIGGTWTHGLCSCADPTVCLTSIFCPCITYGKTQYRLNQRAAKKDPTNMLGYTALNGSCAAFALLCGINGILAAIQHSRVRKTYHMGSEAGNMVSDCLKGCCCCCCTVAQDEKETRRREEAAKGTDLPYQAPGGMVFAAPPR